MVPEPTPVDDPLSPYASTERTPVAGGCWVMANMVAGLDGSAAVRGRVGALSSPRDKELFERVRALADVVLVGAETIRRERYGPPTLPSDLAAARRSAGRSQPRLAMVSGSLNVDPTLPLFTDAVDGQRPIVVTTARSDRSRLDGLPVEVIVAGEARVDLATTLSELGRRGLPLVLCEGGPQLLGELIGADLLDEYFLTLAPVVGGDRLPVVDTSAMRELRSFRLAHVAEEESSLFLRYLREDR
jgi:riboflavin biosynthesis pyrimidine reductase